MGGIISIPAILATVGTAVGASAATATIVGASVIAGVVGTTLSIVGTITKNSTLRNIGLGFSAAGALTGLAAASGLFSGVDAASAALEGGVGAAAEAATEAGVGTVAAQAGTVGGQAGGISVSAAPGATEALASIPAVAAPPGGMVDLATLGAQGPLTSTATGAAGIAPAAAALPPVTPTGASAPLGSAMNPVAPPAPLAPVAPVAPAAPDFMKTALILSAGQAGAGALGGIFQGMSAEKQLELQERINQQNRDQFNVQFARATESPGLIQFAGQQGPGPGSLTDSPLSFEISEAQKAIQSAPSLDANWWRSLDPKTKATIMKMSGGTA